MLRKFYHRIIIVLSFSLVVSCYEESEVKYYSTESIPGKAMKLGKKLQNPYKVSVMKQALENIRKERNERTNQLIEELDIRTTTLYIKFLPDNYDQYDVLVDDGSKEIYDHPLDYEILEEGDYYHDTSIPPPNTNNGLRSDGVEGYTIKQIEDVLEATSTWNSWRDNVINRYDNGTENNLDALFNFWN